MIRRFYVHNFRCFENFELKLLDQTSVLLIGSNGTGKSTIGFALEILQKIARGTNRVSELVKPKDFTRGRTDAPMRFEIEVELQDQIYEYEIAFDYPEEVRELRVSHESLRVAGRPVYARQKAEVVLARVSPERKLSPDSQVSFRIDWHLVALPIVQETSEKDPLFIFKQWLSHMLILRPMPSLILGDSKDETLQPDPQVSNFGAWFSGLLGYAPSAYSKIDQYLKQVMPDFDSITNPVVGKDTKCLTVHFSNDQKSLNLPFEDLSDGEKCFMICALVLAANNAYGPLVCFWDEPDNYLALSEVGHFVMALRKEFQSGGQFIATSHNSEAIARFSEKNTLVLQRKNHLEPPLIRPLDELQIEGDIVNALVRGDI